MNLLDLKALAKRFNSCSDDKAAVDALVKETREASLNDAGLACICERMKKAAGGPAVRLIATEIAEID